MPSLSSSSPVALRSPADRARQAVCFELFGLLTAAPLFGWASGESMRDSVFLLIILSLMATLWSALYCAFFDYLEKRFLRRRADLRPFGWRVLHALGLEGGLILFTLPVIMAWTGWEFWAALLADMGLALFYAGYAYLYHLAYDRLFPLS